MKILIYLTSLLVSLSAFATYTPPDLEYDDYSYSSSIPMSTWNENSTQRVTKWLVDFDANPLAASATSSPSTASIPIGSVIKHVYYKVIRAISSASSNTITLGCDAADDLIGSVSLDGTSSNTLGEGTPDGTFANFVQLNTTSCSPLMTVGAGASGITGGAIGIVITNDALE